MIRKRQPIHLVWPTSKAVRATHDTNEGDAALALNLEMGDPSKNPRGDRGCEQRLGTHRPAEDHLDKILATRHRHVRDNKQVRPLVTRKVNREPTLLERDRVLLADFDVAVTGIASQPFWLSGLDEGVQRRHAPDYLLACADGSVVVVDAKPARMCQEPVVAAL